MTNRQNYKTKKINFSSQFSLSNIYIPNPYKDYMANQSHKILTPREIEVINKKLNNKKLTQLDSNILTRSVRPKLKQIVEIDAHSLLARLSYNPAHIAIENKIKKIILAEIKETEFIILIGSVVQTNFTNYNDIDVIVVTKEKTWGEKYEKENITSDLERKARKDGLNLDLQIISKKAFLNSCSSNPSLIYQLKDHKVIYGKIKIPKNIETSKLELRMKLDWSEPSGEQSGKEIYENIRNLWLVKLLSKKIVDNYRLNSELINELGKELLLKLKKNKASGLEKKFALSYLTRKLKETEQELKEAKWEKIKL